MQQTHDQQRYQQRATRLPWLLVRLIFGLALLFANLTLGFASFGSYGSAQAQGNQPPMLDQALNYWDLGLSIRYPSGWAAPRFTSGQAFLSPPITADTNPLTQPLLALRIVDPVFDLRLAKDATLDLIAISAVGSTPNVKFTIVEASASTLAGMEAFAARLSGEVTLEAATKITLTSQVVSFRMPDGRVGVLQGIAPQDQWAEYGIVVSAIIDGATLIRPKDYPIAPAALRVFQLPAVNVSFTLPSAWVEVPQTGLPASLFSEAGQAPYEDQTRYVNGPALLTLLIPLEQGQTYKAALEQFLQGESKQALQTEAITVGDNIPAARVITGDPLTSQLITFVGFASRDGKGLIVLRWTVPFMLSVVTAPLWDGLLASIKL